MLWGPSWRRPVLVPAIQCRLRPRLAGPRTPSHRAFPPGCGAQARARRGWFIERTSDAAGPASSTPPGTRVGPIGSAGRQSGRRVGAVQDQGSRGGAAGTSVSRSRSGIDRGSRPRAIATQRETRGSPPRATARSPASEVRLRWGRSRSLRRYGALALTVGGSSASTSSSPSGAYPGWPGCAGPIR